MERIGELPLWDVNEEPDETPAIASLENRANLGRCVMMMDPNCTYYLACYRNQICVRPVCEYPSRDFSNAEL